MRYVHLTLTELEAKEMEVALANSAEVDFVGTPDEYKALRRARRKLREGRKQFEIEKQKRSAA